MRKKTIVKAAIASIVSVGLAVSASSALAKDQEMEKCFGVAKAGKNDCGGKGTGHSCQGLSKMNGDPNDWLLVPKGSCDKLVNGSLEAAVDKKTS